MKVIVAKVDENLFDGEADSLTAPGSAGELTILHGHMPLMTTLKEGSIIIRAKSFPQGAQEIPISGGIMEVRHDGATVIL